MDSTASSYEAQERTDSQTPAVASAVGADGADKPLSHATIVPPEGCERVTPDGGVLKRVLKPGSEDKPSLHARCLVHYVARLSSTGEVIMDTKTESQTQQPVRVVAGRDSSLRETGLNLAVATMGRGEVAAVYVEDPKHGFGDKGNFSFPAVPPCARLMYEVELVDWEPLEEVEGADDEQRSGLLFEERLEAAERRRLLGNTLFGAGQFQPALGKYAVALSYLDEDFMMQLEGPYLDRAHAVKVPIHLNMAACQLKIGDYHTAVYNCTEVLNIEKDNIKALFRRGRAKHLLGQTEQAAADLEAAQALAPQDAAIAKELHALRQTMKQERQATAQLFKGAFGATPAGSGTSRETSVQQRSHIGGHGSSSSSNSSRLGGFQNGSSGGMGGAAGFSVLGWLRQCLWGLVSWVGRLVQPRTAVPLGVHSSKS